MVKGLPADPFEFRDNDLCELPIHKFPEPRDIFFLNPVATLIRSYREVLLDGSWPQWGDLLWIVLLSAAVLLPINAFFLRHYDVYPRLIADS